MIDFGIAQALDSTRLTSTGMIIGIPDYMAPEQVTNPNGSGPGADVFAMGATLVYAATGRSPFGAGQAAARAHPTVLMHMLHRVHGRAMVCTGAHAVAKRAPRWLLCSDGLSDLVPVAEMERLLRAEPDETRAVKALWVAAMNASGRDNISIMLVSIRG